MTYTSHRSFDERKESGKNIRQKLHRVDQAHWNAAADRPNPVEVILAHSKERIRELVSLKFKKMAQSPYRFYRGAASLMALDLASQPHTGIMVQMCGDAHILNIGAFAAPDGHLMFDLRDFDETYPGPFEWDLKRLAASLVLAADEAGDIRENAQKAVWTFVSFYRESITNFSQMRMLEFARFEVRRKSKVPAVREVLGRAENMTPSVLLDKFTHMKDGLPRFNEQSHKLVRLDKDQEQKVREALIPYRETISPSRRRTLDAYRPIDVIFKIVGIGSVGTHVYAILCIGEGPGDALFLQFKEEVPSVYEPYISGVSAPQHQGQRVKEGQELIQAESDPFLGYTQIGSRDFIVRQLADHKALIDPKELKGDTLLEFAHVCGRILAKAHARTGDAAVISGYCGESNKLDLAMAKFAVSYADQTKTDHQALLNAIKLGQVQVS